MTILRRSIVALGLSLAACEGNTSLLPTPYAGRTVAASAGALYAVSPEDGALVVTPEGGGPILKIPVGRRPTRVVATSDRVYVSLRGERAVAMLEPRALTPSAPAQVIARIDTGAEPTGLALSADGRRLYVAATMSNAVEVIDTETLTVTARFEVPGQPRWIALHPSEATVYVATLLEGLWRLNLADGRSESVALTDPLPTASGAPRQRRLTGDPAISPDGTKLIVPAMEASNQEPPPEPEVICGEPVPGWLVGGPRIEPVIVTVQLDPADGEPHDEATVKALPAQHLPFPSSVTFTPAGELYAVTSESRDALTLFFADVRGDGSFGNASTFVVEGGPSGVAFGQDGRLHVARLIAPGISTVGIPLPERTGRSMPRPPAAPSHEWRSGLDPKAELGRRLFNATTDARFASGMSCATCHFDGRSDGLTWSLADGPVQTPSLAEEVSARAPLGWHGDRGTVAQDAQRTSELVLGARFTDEQALAVEAFVDSIEGPDLPGRKISDSTVEAGAKVFESLGCVRCHSGALYSDRQLHGLVGKDPVLTPSILGVAATPPYLHDGSYASLEDLVEAAPVLGKGRTDLLSAEDRKALLAFLSSL